MFIVAWSSRGLQTKHSVHDAGGREVAPDPCCKGRLSLDSGAAWEEREASFPELGFRKSVQ